MAWSYVSPLNQARVSLPLLTQACEAGEGRVAVGSRALSRTPLRQDCLLVRAVPGEEAARSP